MSATRRQDETGARRWCTVAALFVALIGVGACDSLLEVDLPDAVTESALDNPSTAGLQVNSVMATFECGYSSFAIDAAGYEDNFQRYTGVAGLYSEYRDTPGGGACDGDAYSSEWIDPLLTSRAQGYDTYERISALTEEEAPNRRRHLAQTALYTALTLDVFGEHFCEMAVDAGELMTPTETLDLAESWIDSVFTHTAATGDFAIETQQGQITSSIETMAYGVRARIRWAKGDLAGAAADAAQVPDGFYAYVLREEGEDRRNMVSSMQGGGGGVQAAGFLQGPIREKADDNDYGVSTLGNNPVTGEPWPDPVPFTGYLNLAIDADGRAVDENGYPITAETAGAVEDVRVPHTIGSTAGGPDNIIQKYTSLADDIPLVSWAEMRLIRAEANPSEAVDHVNAVRNGSVYIGGQLQEIDLPEVDYAPTGDEIDDMIIEERRRALWLEGRYWATKIQNADRLWFPRAQGDWVNQSASYVLNGGVRVLMPQDEYQINGNLSLEDRGTGCSPAQAPVFN